MTTPTRRGRTRTRPTPIGNTDMRATPGLDAQRRGELVAGAGGRRARR